MEVPNRIEDLVFKSSDFDAIALNQVRTDREIIDEILQKTFGTKENQSAIKIGDTWLSIPSRIISVNIRPEQDRAEWVDPTKELINDLNKRDEDKFRNKIGLQSSMTRDPLEKFTGFSVGAENNVMTGDSIGAPAAVIIERNKAIDKVFTLKFQCNALSIHNNIRPLMAQFMLAPFLPVHNADLQRIVTPIDDNIDLYLLYNKGHLDDQGNFIPTQAKSVELDQLFRLADSPIADSPALKNVGGEEMRSLAKYFGRDDDIGEITQDRVLQLKEFLLNKAYWEVPFYIQLIDFSIQSIRDKKSAFEVIFVVRAISTVAAYGTRPFYVKHEDGVKTQLVNQKALEYAYKGDNELIDKITRMFGLQDLADYDGPINISGEDNLLSYSLLEHTNIQNQKIFEFENELRALGLSTTNPAHVHNLVVEDTKNGIISLTPFFINDKSLVTNGEVNEVSTDHGFILNSSEGQDISYTITSTGSLSKQIGETYQYDVGRSIRNNPAMQTVPQIDQIEPLNSRTVPGKFVKLKYSKNPNYSPLAVDDTLDVKHQREYNQRKNLKIVQYNLKNLVLTEKSTRIPGMNEQGLVDQEVGQDRLFLFAKFLHDQNADIIILEEMGNKSLAMHMFRDMLNSVASRKLREPHPNDELDTIKYEAYSFPAGVTIQTVGILTKLKIETSESGVLYPENLAPGIKQLGLDGRGQTRPDFNLRPVLKVMLSRGNGNKLALYCCHFKAREGLSTNVTDSDFITEQVRKLESVALLKEILSLNEDIPYIVAGDFNYSYYPESSGLDELRFQGFSNFIVRNDTSARKTAKVVYRTMNERSRSFEEKGIRSLRQSLSTAAPDPNLTGLFQYAMDFITCEDPALMSLIANSNESNSINAINFGTNIKDYFYGPGNFYGDYLKYGADDKAEQRFKEIRRLIMFNALSPKYAPNPNNNNRSQELAAYRRQYGTFYDEAAAANNIESVFTTIDHILYSYHFFKKDSKVNYTYNYLTNKIIDEYYDGFQAFIPRLEDPNKPLEVDDRWIVDRRVLPVPRNDDPNAVTDQQSREQRTGKWKQAVQKDFIINNPRNFPVIPVVENAIEFSDHYPITSSFSWVYGEEANETLNDSLTPQIFEGRGNDIGQVESIPFPLISLGASGAFSNGDILANLTNQEANNTFRLIAFEHKFGTSFANLPCIILSITYSKLIGRYIFIVGYTKTRLLNVPGIVAIAAEGTDSAYINNAIKLMKQGSFLGIAKDMLRNVYVKEFNAQYTNKPESGDVASIDDTVPPPLMYAVGSVARYTNSRPEFQTGVFRSGKINGSIDSADKDLLNGAPIAKTKKRPGDSNTRPRPLNPNKFVDYFIYTEPQLEGLSYLQPARDIASNISECAPFRNYYTHLLHEFTDASVNKKDFFYTYNADTFEPFVRDFRPDKSFAAATDSSIQFTRKIARKYGRSIFARIGDAINTLINLGDGTDLQRAKFLGALARKVMNGVSNRVILIIKAQQSLNPARTTEMVKRDLIDNVGPVGEWKNVLYAETMIYVGSRINLLRYLLDGTYEQAIQARYNEIKSYTFTARSFTGLSEAEAKRLINLEMEYYAFKNLNLDNNQNTTVTSSEQNSTTTHGLSTEREKIRSFLIAEFQRLASIEERVQKYGERDIEALTLEKYYSSRYNVKDPANRPNSTVFKIETLLNLFNNSHDLLVNKIWDHIKADSLLDGKFAEEF